MNGWFDWLDEAFSPEPEVLTYQEPRNDQPRYVPFQYAPPERPPGPVEHAIDGSGQPSRRDRSVTGQRGTGERRADRPGPAGEWFDFLRDRLPGLSEKENERGAMLDRFRPTPSTTVEPPSPARAFFDEMSSTTERYLQSRVFGHVLRWQNRRSLSLIESQLIRMQALAGARYIPRALGLVVGLREAGRAVYGYQPTYPYLPSDEATELRRAYRGIGDSYYGGGWDNAFRHRDALVSQGLFDRALTGGTYHGQPNEETDNPNDTIQSVQVPHDSVYLFASAEAGWAHRNLISKLYKYGYGRADFVLAEPLVRNLLLAIAFQTPGGFEWNDYRGGKWGIITLLSYMRDNHLELDDVLRLLTFGDQGRAFREQGTATRTAIRTAIAVTQVEEEFNRHQGRPDW